MPKEFRAIPLALSAAPSPIGKVLISQDTGLLLAWINSECGFLAVDVRRMRIL